MISVIIPIYNEQDMLLGNAGYFKNLSKHAELIFVDGASQDRSLEIASGYGKLVSSKKGRATQMNCGASFAGKDVLLFLHADTAISIGTLASIERRVKDNGFIGGCLRQRIDKCGFLYRLIEGFGNIRAKITKVFYGDQGIFVKKDIFLKLGGFPEVAVMEDVIFTKRLRKMGKTIVLADKISASARRWERHGLLRTALLYSFLNILFWLRCHLSSVKAFYEDTR